ncbi:hypothetical protein GCM10010446_01180 [Streptomyces enissocaesilis]|uniref:Tocopherol cyclase-like protein n=2 Tax=Streptomyces enissocaesilis TaxID=332589 RepID=A0ABP6J4L9_9ACTN
MNTRPDGTPQRWEAITRSARRRVRHRWRRTGADFPWGDPLPSHQAPMEGYLWRFTDTRRGRVLLVACGINHHSRQPWGTVVVAADPLGTVRSTSVDGAWASTQSYQICVPATLRYDAGALHVRLGDDLHINCVLREPRSRPRRTFHGSGIFSLVPGLNHYWHPHLFDAKVRGAARLGDQVWDLSDCHVYAEKSWGRGFPHTWWWGQAHGFDRGEMCVAFAGGLLGRGRLTLPVGGVVVSVGNRMISLVPPAAMVQGGERDGRWTIKARNHRYRVRLVGEGTGSRPSRLPIPLLDPHRFGYSTQHLAGNLQLQVFRDGKLYYAGQSALASLETGSSRTRWPTDLR